MNLIDYFSAARGNQIVLARKIGCKQSALSAIANGKLRPSPELAAKIEAITGIPLRELLGVGEPPAVQPEPKAEAWKSDLPEETAEIRRELEKIKNPERVSGVVSIKDITTLLDSYDEIVIDRNKWKELQHP